MHLLYLLNDLVKVAMAHGPHCGCNQVIEMRRHQSFQKRSALLQEDLAGIGHCGGLENIEKLWECHCGASLRGVFQSALLSAVMNLFVSVSH